MLKAKQVAPDFALPQFEGGTIHYYQRAEKRISLLVFYKFSCPTCRMILPFVKTIFNVYGDAFFFAAIAQDGPEKTSEFRKEFNITMPALMDTPPYPVSNTYRITTVPSIFLVNPDHTIRFADRGFVKQDLLNLADVLAEKSMRPQIDLFGEAEVPEFKPG